MLSIEGRNLTTLETKHHASFKLNLGSVSSSPSCLHLKSNQTYPSSLTLSNAHSPENLLSQASSDLYSSTPREALRFFETESPLFTLDPFNPRSSGSTPSASNSIRPSGSQASTHLNPHDSEENTIRFSRANRLEEFYEFAGPPHNHFSEPQRKRLRFSSFPSVMRANEEKGKSTANGSNGTEPRPPGEIDYYPDSLFQKDEVVRLIIQALNDMGYRYASDRNVPLYSSAFNVT